LLPQLKRNKSAIKPLILRFPFYNKFSIFVAAKSRNKYLEIERQSAIAVALNAQQLHQ
jgi:hypothetical protein